MEKQSRLHLELMQVSKRIHKAKFSSIISLTQGEFFTLKMIAHKMKCDKNEKGIYVSELAKKLCMAPSAVSRMLKGLEKKNYIERHIDKADRRNTNVILTEEGMIKFQETKQILETFAKNVIDEMGEEEMIRLIALCNRMADSMDKVIESMNKEKEPEERNKDGQNI